jgi:hypothetical protein
VESERWHEGILKRVCVVATRLESQRHCPSTSGLRPSLGMTILKKRRVGQDVAGYVSTKTNALAGARAFGKSHRLESRCHTYFAYRKRSTQMKSTSDSTKARPMIIAV